MKVILACVVGLVVVAAGACGDTPSTPQPAASITFTPGVTFAKDSAEVTEGRVVIAYVKHSASGAEVQSLGMRIATLPEVEQYAFVLADDILWFFRGRFGDPARAQPELPPIPLHAGFWLLLHDADQAAVVEEELRSEPALRNNGTVFSGVKPARDLYAEIDRSKEALAE